MPETASEVSVPVKDFKLHISTYIGIYLYIYLHIDIHLQSWKSKRTPRDLLTTLIRSFDKALKRPGWVAGGEPLDLPAPSKGCQLHPN